MGPALTFGLVKPFPISDEGRSFVASCGRSAAWGLVVDAISSPEDPHPCPPVEINYHRPHKAPHLEPRPDAQWRPEDRSSTFSAAEDETSRANATTVMVIVHHIWYFLTTPEAGAGTQGGVSAESGHRTHSRTKIQTLRGMKCH